MYKESLAKPRGWNTGYFFCCHRVKIWCCCFFTIDMNKLGWWGISLQSRSFTGSNCNEVLTCILHIHKHSFIHLEKDLICLFWKVRVSVCVQFSVYEWLGPRPSVKSCRKIMRSFSVLHCGVGEGSEGWSLLILFDRTHTHSPKSFTYLSFI